MSSLRKGQWNKLSFSLLLARFFDTPYNKNQDKNDHNQSLFNSVFLIYLVFMMIYFIQLGLQMITDILIC